MRQPTPDPVHDPSWWERTDSARTRLGLLAGILPRAVGSAVAASRRSEDHEVPASSLGPRQVGETALDELFIAGSALVRPVPELEAVELAVEACAGPARELSRLGVAGSHRASGPLRQVTLRRRRLGRLRYEQLDFESRPHLPASLASAGLDGHEVATARVLRHEDRTRPWVVWVHGAEQGRLDDLLSFRARHLHEVLGLNVVLPVLPLHGSRAQHGQQYLSFNPLANVATTIRAVCEVRALVDWIQAQGGDSVTAVGFSLGAPVAALAAGLDPRIDGVAAVVPMLDGHSTVAHHLDRAGSRGRRLAELLRSEPVRSIGAAIDPTELLPYAAPPRRAVIAALNDRVTSIRAAHRLHERWGGESHWHEGGHIGFIVSGAAKAAIDLFLGNQPDDAPCAPTGTDLV